MLESVGLKTGFRRCAHVRQCNVKGFGLSIDFTLLWVDFKEWRGHFIARKLGQHTLKSNFVNRHMFGCNVACLILQEETQISFIHLP